VDQKRRIERAIEESRSGRPAAVSISLGASSRDHSADLELLGGSVHVARIGTDGDMERAARLFQSLDGEVRAFGLGGADLGMLVGGRWYPFHSVRPVVRYVQRTPVVDGSGLKTVLERHAAAVLERHFCAYLDQVGRKVLVVTGSDRFGMLEGFAEHGYRIVCGDLMFGLGVPIALRSVAAVRRLVPIMMPLVGRLPLRMLYPVGQTGETRTPRWTRHFERATVIAGDCHYITRYMPTRMDGKIVVTNTTTPQDLDLFRKAGVRHLVTTTPSLGGRSFGTNALEAALVALLPELQPHDGWSEYIVRLRSAVERAGLKPGWVE
jgi:hypothetical protein